MPVNKSLEFSVANPVYAAFSGFKRIVFVFSFISTGASLLINTGFFLTGSGFILFSIVLFVVLFIAINYLPR